MKLSWLSFCLTFSFLVLEACVEQPSTSNAGAESAEPQYIGGAAADYTEPVQASGPGKLTFRALGVDAVGAGTDFAFLPNTNEVLILHREGRVLHALLEAGILTTLSVFHLSEKMTTGFACGPSNLLIDPQFKENHFIYTSYCVDNRVTRLMRYQWDAENGFVEPRVIFEIRLEEEGGAWHRIGSMGFEPDGVLWLFVGDHERAPQAQDVRSPLGSLLRIVPNRDKDGEGHTYPADNYMDRFESDGQERPHPAIFAYGFRSPWRGTRDTSGRYWVGDVGSKTFEEINFVERAGQNFGWDQFEGNCQQFCSKYVNPRGGYARNIDHPYADDDPLTVDTELRAIWVGEIYEEPIVDRYGGIMDDVVPFGDFFTGWVRGLQVDEAGQPSNDEVYGHLPGVTSWKQGPDDYIYVLDFEGELHVALLGEASTDRGE